MKLTLRLPHEHFIDYPHGVISLGTPINVFILGDLLYAKEYDASAGWYERIEGQETPELKRLALNKYAFSGRVEQLELEQSETFEIYYHVLLDCGAPIHISVCDLEADPGEGDLGEHVPDPGHWLTGVTHLAIDWAANSMYPASQAVQAVVMGIERLVLRPGPGFGEMRSEDTLQPNPLGPDQVFLTLKIYADR